MMRLTSVLTVGREWRFRTMSNEWEKYREIAEERFKNHKASLVVDNERITIIDWRNEDGSSDYYVSFIVDKMRGSLHIDGDLGSCIATWYNPLKIKDLASYIYHDIGYFMGKFQCTSDDYSYDDDDVFDDLMDELDRESVEEYVERSDDYEDWSEFEEAVRDEICESMRGRLFVPTDELNKIATDIFPDAWEFLSDCGQRIDGRVYLWAIGFNMACRQLDVLIM